jgi:hypothetical protein
VNETNQVKRTETWLHFQVESAIFHFAIDYWQPMNEQCQQGPSSNWSKWQLKNDK